MRLYGGPGPGVNALLLGKAEGRRVLPSAGSAWTGRRRVASAGVFVWSRQTAVSGCAQSVAHMVVARLGVAVGEATCSPASTSLIGDLFPGTRRARAVAVWMLGLPLGLCLANGLGGWIAAKWGWRMAFYVAAVPGLVCAVAAWWIREPARGRADGRLLVATAARVISTPPMFLALLRPRGDVAAFSLLTGLGIGAMYAYYATVYSTIQDIVAPSLRGTAMALYLCAMYLLGASLGPVGTGVASD